MAILIEVIVKIIAYSFLFIGLFLLSRPLVIDSYRLYNRNRRMRNQRNVTEHQDSKSLLFKHIQTIVYSVSKEPSETKVWNFIGITLILFLSTVLSIVILTQAYFIGILTGLLIMSVPYIILRFRLANQRLESSVSLMKEFHIFLQSYQKHKDVYHTVYESSRLIRDKRLKKAFNRLLSSIQKERSEKAFIEAVQLFAFSVGSSFASRLSNLLVKSYREQIDVSDALMDLHLNMRKREKDIAALKTKQLETQFVGFMPIVITPFFVFLAYRMTMMYDMSFVLSNSGNLIGLILVLFLSIVSALFAYLMGKPRADL